MVHVSPHPELHPIFETLGYALGYGAYKSARRHAGDVLHDRQRWSVIAATMVGALIGSRVLGLFEQIPRKSLTLSQWIAPGGGKTIVGGLLGGWIAVEIIKKIEGIRTRTGDHFALPLGLGLGIGVGRTCPAVSTRSATRRIRVRLERHHTGGAEVDEQSVSRSIHMG